MPDLRELLEVGAGDPHASGVQVGERCWQVVHRTEQQMLDGPGRGLDGRWTERRLAMCREQDAVDTGGLGAAQERSNIVRIFQGIEDQDERRLSTLGRTSQDVVGRRKLAGLHDEGDPLVAVEASERRERAALDFDDGDPQVRRMQHELFQGLPSLRHDQHADRWPSSHEGFLDRAATCDELFVGSQLFWCR